MMLRLSFNAILLGFESVGGYNCAGAYVMHLHHELIVLYNAFYYGRERLFAFQVGSAAYYLRPFSVAVGSIEAIFVLVSGDDELASGFLK